jgi:predicted dehydrogenase/threonine dehydrogenase-like Zn-dependent dehydrogenase
MKQVLIKQGKAIIEEVPAPQNADGRVLVQVDHSCISIGTELSGLKSTAAPLWKRALADPGKVAQVVKMVASDGFARTQSLVQGKLQAGSPTGYSAAGVVIEVGSGIDDLRSGDRVACAGAQYAHHAEIISVPRNLVTPIPESLDFASASTVTLGAIALQGVRRAAPTLGESFIVIGLGILGQITSQLLKANGCRAIGIDLDKSRIEMASSLGMDVGVHPDDGDDIQQVVRLTDGIGADGVIITAATPSDAVISTAFRMCRRKGRVVLVGDVGLHLNRADFYAKEIDFFISTSYGPGRYDHHYEEKGLDYPAGYVRWTENRNMAEYLRLMAEGRVQIAPLIAATYPIDQAGKAYASLSQGDQRPLMVLLHYPRPQKSVRAPAVLINPMAQPAKPGRIRMALIGAGGFARGTHLPNLQALSKFYALEAVATRSGHSAAAIARQFGIPKFSTDTQAILADPTIDAVLIATRHNLHAGLTLAALKAGKHVLVEKPLALTRAELEDISAFYASPKKGATQPVLLTGFNRRFSPFALRMKEIVDSRSNPMILNYRMNAGYIPLDHWVHTEEGGGRNLGEACHIYDLFTYLTDSRVISVQAQAIRPTTGYYNRYDNFVASMSFEDGSVATLTYTALGASEYPKERMEVYVDGRVLELDNYTRLTVHGAAVKGVETSLIEKGHRRELEEFARTIQSGGEWPAPLWQQIQATEIALQVEELLR